MMLARWGKTYSTNAVLGQPVRGRSAVRSAIVLSSVGLVISGMGLLWTPAPATAKTPPPKIVSFKTNPSSLSNAGGKVELQANVQNAVSCTFSSTKPVSGLPATLPCSNGTVATTVTFPANSGTKSVKDEIVLAATGTTTVKATKAVVVGTKPPVPTIKSMTPSSGSILGNTLVSIVGSDLTDVTSVSFGGSSGIGPFGSVISIQSDSQITVTSAETSGPGIVDVVVILGSGTMSATTTADQFTYVSGPGGFPSVITGSANGVSSIDTPAMPETSWSGSFTLDNDDSACPNVTGNLAACYSVTGYSGSGTHAWWEWPSGPEVCTAPFSFSTSGGPLDAYIEIDSAGVYHLYFYMEYVVGAADFAGSCSSVPNATSDNILIGLEHANDGSDTMSPDSFQIGQTTLTSSGTDAGGDGLNGNGISAPGWTTTANFTFTY